MRRNATPDAIRSGIGVRKTSPGEWIQDVHRLGRGRRVHACLGRAGATAYRPNQVVGSTVRTRYELRGDAPVLMRLPEVDFIDDHAGKPVGIGKFIGKRPIAAFGNSDGDYEMLRYVTAGTGPRFGLIVHHTDADREYAYDRDSLVGRLVRALDEAPTRGWTVVDMKRDWGLIFRSREVRSLGGRAAFWVRASIRPRELRSCLPKGSHGSADECPMRTPDWAARPRLTLHCEGGMGDDMDHRHTA